MRVRSQPKERERERVKLFSVGHDGDGCMASDMSSRCCDSDVAARGSDILHLDILLGSLEDDRDTKQSQITRIRAP